MFSSHLYISLNTWGTVLQAAGEGKCLEKMSRYMYSSFDLGVLIGNLRELFPCLILLVLSLPRLSKLHLKISDYLVSLHLELVNPAIANTVTELLLLPPEDILW